MSFAYYDPDADIAWASSTPSRPNWSAIASGAPAPSSSSRSSNTSA